MKKTVAVLKRNNWGGRDGGRWRGFPRYTSTVVRDTPTRVLAETIAPPVHGSLLCKVREC